MNAKTTLDLAAISAFGLESYVKHELSDLGYPPESVDNGRIFFKGNAKAIVRANIHLRTSDRIQIVIKRYQADNLDDYFDALREIPWIDFIPPGARIVVSVHSTRSPLRSTVTCQSMAKKAIVDSLLVDQKTKWLREDGQDCRIDIGIRGQDIIVTLDTSGAGLNKRGYRLDAVEAPLRETLAAAIVLTSRWNPTRILADPLCGSGTIAIEAALIGNGIAPGIQRSFSAENWRWIPRQLWADARHDARAAETRSEFHILASDIDFFALKAAQQNAERAGVARYIRFQKKPISEFRSRKAYGCMVTNPPYGERVGDRESAAALYKEIGEVFKGLDRWSAFILSGHEDFQRNFGQKSTRNRKLYNGNIRCYLYEYLGELPPPVHSL